MTDTLPQSDGSLLVLVVGAGINGAAVARELTLNGVSVVVVDANDIAFGATSRSSRLIHGGLRYLERGDVALVRESLRERERLLRTASDFVKPLTLRIPVRRRFGGLVWSVLTFCGWESSWLGQQWLRLFPHGRERGLWLIRLGLWMYARMARGPFDRVAIRRDVDLSATMKPIGVGGAEYRYLCEYTDAQIVSPERFTVALLRDARKLAGEAGCAFDVVTHTLAEVDGASVTLIDRLGRSEVRRIRPDIIINATGAWGDSTLADWQVHSPPLFGGTKGSHFITEHRELRATLGDGGIYAEASDGRMVFVLPFGSTQTLVGTTDEPFDARPETAVAEPREIDYLIELVNSVLPGIELSRADVTMTYSGVRPLPVSRSDSTAAIPRGHSIAANETGPIPILTLIGGKLTTCRALAEEVGDLVLERLRLPRRAASRERLLRERSGFTAFEALDETGTRAVIRDEWVRTLGDLVERRLMLMFDRGLDEPRLRELAGWLADEVVIPREHIEAEVIATKQRLSQMYSCGATSK